MILFEIFVNHRAKSEDAWNFQFRTWKCYHLPIRGTGISQDEGYYGIDPVRSAYALYYLQSRVESPDDPDRRRVRHYNSIRSAMVELRDILNPSQFHDLDSKLRCCFPSTSSDPIFADVASRIVC